MSIVRLSPLFNRPINQWPDMWDDMVSTVSNVVTPNLDVFETENEVVVRANVAGVREKEIDVTFEKGVLWIKADRQEEAQDDKKKHYSQSSWSYSYKIAVPGMLDFSAEPELELEDGMLVVRFKKAEASKPKKLSISKKSK